MYDAAMPNGLTYRSQFVSPHEASTLIRCVDTSSWRDDLRRRVQHYGFRYNYRSRSVGPADRIGPLPHWLADLAERVAANGVFDRPPDQAIVNEYQPGQGIAAHIDCRPCFGPAVATLSLGSPISMQLDRGSGTPWIEIRLEAGSLLVLTGEARAAWRHGIVGRKADIVEGQRIPRTRRLSITFRTIKIGAATDP